MLLVDRFQHLGLNYEQMVLAAGVTYCFVRFGVARLLMRYTVHRGMFHSIPALLIFTGLAFLLCGFGNLHLRYFKAGGVFLGVLSHLRARRNLGRRVGGAAAGDSKARSARR